ncbi:MAG: hypothetical protein JWO19_4391 [Bryobacterales bacterium]|nr:hypothetical protein [Bryobacterales bacterium]
MKAKVLEMIQAVPPPGMVRISIDGQVRFLTPLAAKVLRNEFIRVWPQRSLEGRRFGKLVVLERNRRTQSYPHHWMWLCECDCGQLTVKVGYNLTSGGTRSCGCLKGRPRSKH